MNPIRVTIAILMVLLIQPAFPQDDPYLTELKQWAEQGDAEAQYNLGETYYFGQGVLQNYKEAVHWYRMAADQGYAKAQYNLGGMYNQGEGVRRDYVLAHMWYNLAALQQTGTDRKKSVKRRKDLERKMQGFDVRKAQRLAREFKPNPSELTKRLREVIKRNRGI